MLKLLSKLPQYQLARSFKLGSPLPMNNTKIMPNHLTNSFNCSVFIYNLYIDNYIIDGYTTVKGLDKV